MAEPARRALGDGAAEAAPTAPHATPRRTGGRASGPERFWARWPGRVALSVALALSLAAHGSLVPIEPASFEMREVEGEASIPIDVLQEEEEPVTPPAPPSPDEVKPPSEADQARDLLAAAARRDAGAPLDGGPDGAADAATDARDAGEDGGASLDGALALAADAGPEAGAGAGPHDPAAILGAAGDIQADVVLVMVVVNAEVIRKNPEGAGMGFLLRGIPQWEQFMHGTDIDPVRDVDWIMISGPSLLHTDRDVVLLRTSASDAQVDRAMDAVAANYAKGGGYDAGVPGMRAVRSYADGAERVILQPRSHVLAVVPPAVAPKVAKQLAHASVPAHIRKGEAVYLRLVNPHHPMPEMPESISALSLRVVPRDDLGADVFVDCETPDAAAATAAARELKTLVERRNTMLVSAVTLGLLDGVEVSSEGSLARLHLAASRAQIANLVSLVAEYLGVGRAAPKGSPSAVPGLAR